MAVSAFNVISVAVAVMPTSTVQPSNATAGTGAVSGHFFTRSARGTQASAINHKYGSVKYNRVASSVGVKEEVHETHSNPITFTATASVGGASCGKCLNEVGVGLSLGKGRRSLKKYFIPIDRVFCSQQGGLKCFV